MEKWVKYLIMIACIAIFLLTYVYLDYMSFFFVFVPFCCWDNYRQERRSQEQEEETGDVPPVPVYENQVEEVRVVANEGKTQIIMRLCNTCNGSIKQENLRFCPYCGTKL